jgi:hypothetical protein
MFEQSTRTLLGPADPARERRVPRPRLTAADLIRRAEAGPAATPAPTHRRPTRRLALAGVVVAVAAAAGAYPLFRGDDDPGAGHGSVLVPIAYQITDNPPPAADHLRALADTIADAPYDGRTGRYTYVHYKSWGGVMQGTADGHEISYTEELQTWSAADGSGRIRHTMLEPEYRDEASRRAFEKATAPLIGRQNTDDLGPGMIGGGRPLPADRPTLTRRLNAGDGPAFVARTVADHYQSTAIPRPIRAEILRVLADQKGFVWRGTVTDRAGRPGVAITADEKDVQSILVFDPRTGALLALETVSLGKHWVDSYLLILDTARTDNLG